MFHVSLKAQCRLRVLRHILHHISGVANAIELSKKVNILHAILWATPAQEKTIQACFARCGCGEEQPEEVIYILPPDQDTDQLMDGTQWADYVDHDTNTDTTAPLSDM